MRIKKIHIENYGSLRDLSLDVGNFVVLIGKNGSGKSLLLEAVDRFFTEFSLTGGGATRGASDYLWFDRIVDNPMVFTFTFELADKEIESIIPLPKKILEKIKKNSEELYNELEICRVLDYGGGWRTNYIKWAGQELVKDDKMSTSEELTNLFFPRFSPEPLPPDNYMFYFFESGYSPKNIGGNRLLVNKNKKIAYISDPRIDSLVAAGVIQSLQETVGLDCKEWATQQEYSLVERAPTPHEIPEISSPITPDLLRDISANISNKIKGRFRLIPAARNVKATLGERTAFIEPTTLDSMRTLSISTSRPEELKWGKFRKYVEKFFHKRLEPNPEQILINDGDLRLPVHLLGGGEQEVLGLMWHLIEKDMIYGIEEPENHLHPDISRGFLKFLKELSRETQILIVTHSPIFVDKIDIQNNWIIWKEGKETAARRIENRDDFKLILWELGVVPSDIYLKDFVIFVEGGTEKEAVLPIFAQKLGLESIEDKVAIISVGGESQLKNHLRIWLEIVKYAPVDYLVILDKHGEELAFKLIKEMGVKKEKFVILEKRCIEDYYPIDILVNAINELFGLEITEKDIDERKQRDKEIERILRKNNKIRRGWKIQIGEYVAEKMSTEKIPADIKKAIEKAKALTQT